MHKLVLIIISGILCHWFAWRLKIPSIALFSIVGLFIGPVFHLVDPSQDFGVLVEAIIKLALAIILFEGGLNLKFHELTHSGKAVKHLILFGLPLSVSDSWKNLQQCRLQGIPIHYGEILSESVEENLELADMGYLLAITGNHAYNSLVCSVFIQHFGRNRVFQIATSEKKSRGNN